MKVGLYFDMRNPQPWVQDPSRLYGFSLEMCEEAERLGADSIWVTEHHLFDDGYLPQPLTMAAAVAARTSRVRVGTAVVIAPLHHPLHLAEQAAVVDLISGGRLELGLGAGYRKAEFAAFGASFDSRYGTTDGRVRELRDHWSAGRALPAPVQERIPIWLGYAGPQGARRAGLLGEGLLTASQTSLEPYLAGLVEGGHSPATARMAGNAAAWVTDDPERDWPTVSQHVAHQFDSYRRYAVEGTDAPAPKPVDPNRLVAAPADRPLGAFRYGTPEQVAASLRDMVGDAPVETMLFWASIAGMPEEMVARGIETVCTRLRPLLADVGVPTTDPAPPSR